MDYGLETALEMSGHEPRVQPGYGGYTGYGGGFGQGSASGNTPFSHSHPGHQQGWNMQQQNFQQGVVGPHGHPQPFNQSFQGHNNQFNNPNHQYRGPSPPPTYHHPNQGHHGPYSQPQGYPSGVVPFNAHGHPRQLPQPPPGIYTHNGLWVPQNAEASYQRPAPVPVTVPNPHLQAPNAPQGNPGFIARSTNQEGPLIFMEPANTIPFTNAQGTLHQHPPHQDRSYGPLDLNVPAKVPSPLLEIAKAEQPIHNNPNCRFPHPVSVACAVCGPPMRLHERFHTMPEQLWRPSLEVYARKVQAKGQTTLSPQQALSNSTSKHESKPRSALPSTAASAVPLLVIPAVQPIDPPAMPPLAIPLLAIPPPVPPLPAPPQATPPQAIPPQATPTQASPTQATPQATPLQATPPQATLPPSIPPPAAPPPSMLDNLLPLVTTAATISDPRAQFLAARDTFERVKALEESSSNPQAPPPRIPNPYLRMRDWAEVIGVNPRPGVGVSIANTNIRVRRPNCPSGAFGQRRFFQRPPEAIALLSNSTITTVGNPRETLITFPVDSAQNVLNDESEVKTRKANNKVNAGTPEEAAPDIHAEPALPLTPTEPTEQELAVIERAIPLAIGEIIQREPVVIQLALPPTPMQRESEGIVPALPLIPAEPTQQKLALIEPVLPLTPAEPTQQELEAKQQDLPVTLTPVQPAQQAAAGVEPALPLAPTEPTQQEVETKQQNLPEAPMQVQPPEPGQEVAPNEPTLPLDLVPTGPTQQHDHEIADNQQQSAQEREPTSTSQAEVHTEEQTVKKPTENPPAAEPATDQPRTTATNQPEPTDSDVHPEPTTQPQPRVAVFSWASIVAGDRQRERERIRLAAEADGTLLAMEDAKGLDNPPGLSGDALPE